MSPWGILSFYDTKVMLWLVRSAQNEFCGNNVPEMPSSLTTLFSLKKQI